MKRALKQRVLITMVATVVAAACGLLAAYLLGRAIALHLTESRLSYDATRAISDSAEFSRDAHAVLDAMNALPAPLCSDKDMAALLELVYHSHYLKEAGRVRDGKIVCSTTLGRLALSGIEQPRPDYIGADGVKVYINPPQFRLEGIMVTSLQAGDSYVVFNPYIYSLRESTTVHFIGAAISTAQSQFARQVNQDSNHTRTIPARDGDFRIGDILYSTRCSPRDDFCMTASLSVSEALQANHGELKALLILGGPAGGLFGFVVALLYRRNRSLDHQLRRAIRNDTLRVEYQQIMTLTGERIVGAEALARWTDEDGFAVGPDIFVKIAEEHGYVGSITRLVVSHVLRDFAATLRAQPDFRVSINVAATDLADPRFLPMLEHALKQAEVPAASLIIEITESSTARHETAIAAILRLRQRGHSVHIDDFGTGYSSLSYLHDLSVDAIKIDRIFTQSIGTEAVTAAILPQILSMAKVLHLQVIAEGIETRQQAEYFAGLAQPILGQGWLFGRSIAADVFHSLLAECEKKALAGTDELVACVTRL
jgi:sensor c-di-GMP phosphodiesterase-like protein